MQEREAKILLASKDLKDAVIQPNIGQQGWTITFKDKNEQPQPLVSKRSNDPRLFKTSDAALRCCARIGFNQVEVLV